MEANSIEKQMTEIGKRLSAVGKDLSRFVAGAPLPNRKQQRVRKNEP